MNIDQQLRAALSQEAEMHTAPPPDVDRLIIGGKVRQRRRTWARVGVAAAVAVLVAGGAYGVTRVGSGGTAVGPAGSPSPTSTPPPRRTGTRDDPAGHVPNARRHQRRRRCDLRQHHLRQHAWQSDNYPVVLSDPNGNGGVAVYQPLGLSAGTGCIEDNKLNTNVGDTPQTLAQQLAGLPQSTVLQAPAPVQALGHDAIHLRLRINNNCGAGVYRVAETIRGTHGITYDPVRPVVIDFWVLDQGGVPVVVETWHEINSPSWLVDDIAQTKDSVTFETGE